MLTRTGFVLQRTKSTYKPFRATAISCNDIIACSSSNLFWTCLNKCGTITLKIIYVTADVFSFFLSLGFVKEMSRGRDEKCSNLGRRPAGIVVVSIGLFWFYFLSFLYKGVYFLCFFFNCKLGRYQRCTLILPTFSSAENYFLTLTLCSFVSNV